MHHNNLMEWKLLLFSDEKTEKHRKVNQLAFNHTADKWWPWNSAQPLRYLTSIVANKIESEGDHSLWSEWSGRTSLRN